MWTFLVPEMKNIENGTSVLSFCGNNSCPPTEMVRVVLQLVLNVGELRVELVVLGFHSRVKAFVSCHGG